MLSCIKLPLCSEEIPRTGQELYLTKLKTPFSLILQIWQLLSVLRHPVTIAVTDFITPDNLTNDLLILKLSLFLTLRGKKDL